MPSALHRLCVEQQASTKFQQQLALPTPSVLYARPIAGPAPTFQPPVVHRITLYARNAPSALMATFLRVDATVSTTTIASLAQLIAHQGTSVLRSALRQEPICSAHRAHYVGRSSLKRYHVARQVTLYVFAAVRHVFLAFLRLLLVAAQLIVRVPRVPRAVLISTLLDTVRHRQTLCATTAHPVRAGFVKRRHVRQRQTVCARLAILVLRVTSELPRATPRIRLSAHRAIRQRALWATLNPVRARQRPTGSAALAQNVAPTTQC
mmetsp:Transcript_9677/g.24848  ORF Transcript_9677/g.24848 Transcript_9677/m.24848 type:complete len:264 (+) Transcript_9677:1852-2643(+)